MANLDWTLIRSFLAVADAGSLSAAARALSISQPTLGRHIKALESSLSAELFQRRPRGFELTDAGEALVPGARQMAEAAARLRLAAAGREEDLSGTVRITASVIVAHYLLPPIIADMRRVAPEIQIELVASDATDNLLYREADIALRMYRPTQPDVLALSVGELQMGLFAAKSYLAEHPAPREMAELFDHDLVGFDRDTRIIDGLAQYGVTVGRDAFATRCDAQAVFWELVRAGCGIGTGQLAVGRRDPLVRQVLPDLPITPLPLWLVSPADVRRAPRVARVWDHLKSALRPLVS